MVTVNVTGVLVQVTPLAVLDATTVKVLVSGAVVALAAVKAGTLPVPDVVAKPIASLVRDQVKIAPGTELLNVILGTVALAHCTTLATEFIVGTAVTPTLAERNGRQAGSGGVGDKIA